MYKYSHLTKCIWGFCVVFALVLTACNQIGSSSKPDPTQTANVPNEGGLLPTSQGSPAVDAPVQITPSSASYPFPGTEIPTQVDLGASTGAMTSTPVPGGEAYPNPGSFVPTSIPPNVDAYPGPGSGVVTQTPAPYNPYPEPETGLAASPTPPQSFGTPSPEPLQPTITPTTPISVSNPTSGLPVPSQTNQATIPDATPATATIEPTGTPFIVRTEMQATDPSTVDLASGNPQLVELFAFWSPTSKSMAPVVHALEDKYQSRIGFVYLDIDDPRNNSFKQALGYKFPPQFFLLDRDGNIIYQWQGYVSSQVFEQAFAAFP
jgi:thiol-disulfide isomerase/thioredoxin